MAGSNPSNPGFDAAFREKIRAAMLMGTPNVVSDRATFIIPGSVTFADVDSTGAPWDWSATPATEVAEREVQVLCAVEPKGGGEDATGMGTFDTDEVKVYLFEDEWAQVSGFTAVRLGGSLYERVKRLPPLGLYGVQIEVVECKAVDES